MVGVKRLFVGTLCVCVLFGVRAEDSAAGAAPTPTPTPESSSSDDVMTDDLLAETKAACKGGKMIFSYPSGNKYNGGCKDGRRDGTGEVRTEVFSLHSLFLFMSTVNHDTSVVQR
jgi:hypothetical protein